jgi:hypothetical protein
MSRPLEIDATTTQKPNSALDSCDSAASPNLQEKRDGPVDAANSREPQIGRRRGSEHGEVDRRGGLDRVRSDDVRSEDRDRARAVIRDGNRFASDQSAAHVSIPCQRDGG